MPIDERFSILDRPEILQFTFYQRRDKRKGPSNSTDYQIPVADGVSIGCRFYRNHHSLPTILFFHGNGEIVSDYDGISPLYTQMGANLFVADYRGYGSSGGTPTYTGMVSDAHPIFHAFREILSDEQYIDSIFIMGRSLGSISAIELASSYQEQAAGLVIESGFGSISRLMGYLGYSMELPGISDASFPNSLQMSNITLPTLIIHGEYDNLVPPVEAEDLYNHSAADNKRLVIIEGAGHNDILFVGTEKYSTAVRKFVTQNKERRQG